MMAGAPRDRMQTPGKYAGPSSCACQARSSLVRRCCILQIPEWLILRRQLPLTMMPAPGAYALTSTWLGGAVTLGASFPTVLLRWSPKIAVLCAMRVPNADSHAGSFAATRPFGVTEPP